MPTRHGTPQMWHVPIPLRSPAGTWISYPLRRPTFQSVVLTVGLVYVGATVLAAGNMQHHTVASWTTYTACGTVALLTGRVVRRFAQDERVVRVCGGTLAAADIWFSATSDINEIPLLPPMLTVGVVALATAAGELGYRLSERRRRLGIGVVTPRRAPAARQYGRAAGPGRSRRRRGRRRRCRRRG